MMDYERDCKQTPRLCSNSFVVTKEFVGVYHWFTFRRRFYCRKYLQKDDISDALFLSVTTHHFRHSSTKFTPHFLNMLTRMVTYYYYCSYFLRTTCSQRTWSSNCPQTSAAKTIYSNLQFLLSAFFLPSRLLGILARMNFCRHDLRTILTLSDREIENCRTQNTIFNIRPTVC